MTDLYSRLVARTGEATGEVERRGPVAEGGKGRVSTWIWMEALIGRPAVRAVEGGCGGPRWNGSRCR
jgi:hypothetical protein